MIDYFKQYFKLVITFNAIVVAIAYGLEYFLNLSLCQICHYQRYIFIVIIVIALIAVFAKFTHKIAAVLIVLLFFANSSIALTQVLMEEGYIAPSVACTGLIPTGVVDLELFKAKILNNDFVPCDAAEVRFLNISLAGFSFIASTAMFFFGLVFVSILLLFRYKNEEDAMRNE